MQTILLETRIAAPALRVFLLSLSVDLHVASTKQTGERAIAGVTTGLMGLHDEVTWQGRHFGLMLKQSSKITRYEAPFCFEDTMIRGIFSSFRHVHYFDTEPSSTLMRDELFFEAPLGIFGTMAERLFLKTHLTHFLRTRNELIRKISESDSWQQFIPLSLQSECS